MRIKRSLYGLALLLFCGAIHAVEPGSISIFRDPAAPATPGKAEVNISKVDPGSYESIPLDGVMVCIPGASSVRLSEGVSVIDAIRAAGGLNRITSKHSISIITEERTSAISFWGLEIESEGGITFYSKIKLKAGDILIVSELCLL